jgi:glucokinase
MRPGLRLGVDLGGTHVKMALVERSGRVKALVQVDTVKDPRVLVARLKESVRPWLGRKLLGTGVGVAGDVDPAQGSVRFSPNLGWHHVPLKDLLRSAGFPRPLFVENDANAAAWGAYHLEMKRRCTHLIVLTLGTGVGGGVVLNGRLYRGITGSAGELGHVSIDPDGTPCGCGSSGCLETFLGAAYLKDWMRREMERQGRKMPDQWSPQDMHKAARQGDRMALRLWERAGRALGVGLANFINIFNPDTILLCGGIAGASDFLLRYARPEIRQRTFQTPRRAVRIRVAKGNQQLGVVGSALLVE